MSFGAFLASRDDRRIIVLFLGLAVIIRIVLVFVLPHGQAFRFRLEGLNDEPSHYNYVRYLADHRELPVQTASARDPDGYVRSEFEYYQPPVYYVTSAFFHAAMGTPGSLYASRFLSALFGFFSLLVIWRIFGQLGLPPMVQSGALLFAALLPTYAYFSSMVSNDSLSWLTGLLITAEMVDYRRMLSPSGAGALKGKTLRITALLALGMLVKSSLLLFYPPILVMYGYCFLKTRNVRFLIHGAWIVGGSFIVISPWYLRNIHLYGSLTAIEVGNGPAQRYLLEPRQIVSFIRNTIWSFWYPSQRVATGVGRNLSFLVGVAILAFNLALTVQYCRDKRRIGPLELFLLLLLALNAVAHVQYNMLWHNSEGRFFFPSLVAILLFFTVPLHHFLLARGKTFYFFPIIIGQALWPYLNLLMKVRPF